MLTGLHATQLGTLGTTAPHNSTYPEYSWLVLCVVLCYAVGVLCYAVLVALYADVLHTLCTVSIIHVLLLLHHPSHVVCIHRGGLLLIGPWLRRCSCTASYVCRYYSLVNTSTVV